MLKHLLSACIVALPFTAQSALINRGSGLIYDDVLDITWLQDVKYALTMGHPPALTDNPSLPGRMTFTNASDWVNNLEYFDSVRGVTLTDWRLPKINPDGLSPACLSEPGPDNCIIVQGPDTGEMAHLFYATLGNTAATGLANTGPFINFEEADYFYGDLFSPSPGSMWDFAMNIGRQGASVIDTGVQIAWAVRDGDVSPVPIPSAVWLFGSGLIGLFGVARRKTHS